MDGLIIQKPILFDFGKCHLLICYEFGLLIYNYSPDSKIFACTVGSCQELMFGKSCVLYRHIQCPFKKIKASNGLVLTLFGDAEPERNPGLWYRLRHPSRTVLC